MLHKLDTLEKIRDYVVNIHSNFIIKNTNTNNSIEFYIKLKKNSTINKRIYYVYLKYIRSYYIGTIIFEDIISDGKDRINKWFTLSKNIHTEIVEVNVKSVIFQKFFEFIYIKEELPNGIEIYHTGQCAVCGRKLTNPKYMEIGIGPKCIKNK